MMKKALHNLPFKY